MRAHHSTAVTVNLIDTAIYAQVMNDPSLRIDTYNYPLNKTGSTKTEEYLKSGTDLTVAINVIIALSFVPASFVVFLLGERVSNAKHLQFVSGMDPVTYWLANFSWDLFNYALPALICVFIFLAFSLPSYTGKHW